MRFYIRSIIFGAVLITLSGCKKGSSPAKSAETASSTTEADTSEVPTSNETGANKAALDIEMKEKQRREDEIEKQKREDAIEKQKREDAIEKQRREDAIEKQRRDDAIAKQKVAAEMLMLEQKRKEAEEKILQAQQMEQEKERAQAVWMQNQQKEMLDFKRTLEKNERNEAIRIREEAEKEKKLAQSAVVKATLETKESEENVNLRVKELQSEIANLGTQLEEAQKRTAENYKQIITNAWYPGKYAIGAVANAAGGMQKLWNGWYLGKNLGYKQGELPKISRHVLTSVPNFLHWVYSDNSLWPQRIRYALLLLVAVYLGYPEVGNLLSGSKNPNLVRTVASWISTTTTQDQWNKMISIPGNILEYYFGDALLSVA